MDLQKLFMSSKPSHICIFFFIFFTLAKHTLSLDTKFQACMPRTCGNGPNISYPFWIPHEQESFCGLPSFEVICRDRNSFFSISNVEYIIKDIFYANYSLLVANAAAYKDTCPAPLHSISIHQTQLDLSSDNSDFSIFYNCTSFPDYPIYEIECASNSSHLYSFATFHKEVLEQNYYSSGSCQSSVDVPVDVPSGVNFTSLLEMNYTEIMKMGFLLNWNVYNCSSCQISGGRCGFDDNDKLVCFCRGGPRLKTCNDGNSVGIEVTPKRKPNWRVKTGIGRKVGRSKVMIIAIASSLSTVIGVLIIGLCFNRKLRSIKITQFSNKESLTHQSVVTILRNTRHLSIRRYSYSDIKKMTNFFKDKLGQGGYGCVYKGKLQDGSFVAVKVLKELKGDGEEFINEVMSISRTNHVNIVTLKGFCFESSKRALIYEFMPNGSLEKFIYKKAPQKIDHQLGWETLYRIAIGIAQGLKYLHSGCNTRILHFDIKPHNILLDANFCPKISDFGLSKICPRENSIISMSGAARGTVGYIAPEVFCRNFGGVSHKSDVYSYGMMVLEIVGGTNNIDAETDHTSETYFPHWIYRHLELDKELWMQGIINEEDEQNVKKMIIVGLWCIQTNPSNRPTMNRVVDMLVGSLNPLQIPPKPYLSSPSRSLGDSLTEVVLHSDSMIP